MFSRQENNRRRPRVVEVTVSVVVLLAAFLFAIPYVNRIMRNFEKTTVQQIVSQLNSVAQFKLAEYVALDKLKLLPKQLDDNPMNWISPKDIVGWEDYAGEVKSVIIENLDGGQWQYDLTTKRLIYKVKYIDKIINDDPKSNRIQFRFKLEFVDYNDDGIFDENTDTISGLHIEPVYSYHWING